jgi:hypothetical protein
MIPRATGISTSRALQNNPARHAMSWKTGFCLLASACLLSACLSLPMTKSSFMATLQNSDGIFNTPFEHMLVKKMIKSYGVAEFLHRPEALRAAYVAVHEFDNFTMTAKEKARYEKTETEAFAVMTRTNIIEECIKGSALPPYGVGNIDHDCIDRYGYQENWHKQLLPNHYTDEYIAPWKWKNNIPFAQKVRKFTEKSNSSTIIRDLDANAQARYLDMVRNHTVGDWLSEYPTRVLVDTMNLARLGKIPLASSDLKHAERIADAWILMGITSIKYDCWKVEEDGSDIFTLAGVDQPYPECLAFHGYPMSKRRIEELRKQGKLPAAPIRKSASNSGAIDPTSDEAVQELMKRFHESDEYREAQKKRAAEEAQKKKETR